VIFLYLHFTCSLGGNAWGARYRTDPEPQQQQYSNSTVVAGERVRPSEVFDKSGDALDKYRIKDPEQDTAVGTSWEIHLVNLPAGPGSSIELTVGGKQLFQGEGQNGVVHAMLTSTPASDSASFLLKIPFVNFVFSRDLSAANGTFVRFAVEPSGMKFRQQKSQFTE